MMQSERFNRLFFWSLLAVGLVCAYLSIQNLHFVYDDYELYLSDALSDSFVMAVLAKLTRQFRLGQELYNTLLVYPFGLDRGLILAMSLVLHLAVAALFHACLLRAFPGRRRLAATAAVLAAAMPMVTATLFIAFMDTSRMALALTFLAILLYQGWAARPDRVWPLAVAVVCVFAGFTFYENALLFLAAVPLLSPETRSFLVQFRRDRAARAALLKAVGAAAGLVGLIAAHRYLLGYIDVDIPAERAMGVGELMVAYGQAALSYLAQASVPGWAGVGALLVALPFALATVLAAARAEGRGTGWLPVAAALGVALTVLGMLPFAVADYGPPKAWSQEIRVLSSASYGIALLIALIPELLPAGKARLAAGGMLAVVVAAWMGFWFEIRGAWVTAARQHCEAWTSLLRQVPHVEGRTAILFLDLRGSVGDVPVLVNKDSLLALVQLLYKARGQDGQVFGYHLDRLPKVTMSASPQGIETLRSSLHAGAPLPLDRLILVRRDGSRMEVLDRVTRDAGEFGIDWRDGVSELRTNPDLIRQTPRGEPWVRDRLAVLGMGCGQ